MDFYISILLDMKLADAVAALTVAAAAGVVRPSTLSIFDFNSSTVFVTAVTISIGVPFLPMKNNDGNGTNLSAREGKNKSRD